MERRQKVRVVYFILSLILIITGFSKLLNSVEDGVGAANKYNFEKMDGVVDTAVYHTMIEGYIARNISIGTVILTAGLIILGITLYKVSKTFIEEDQKIVSEENSKN